MKQALYKHLASKLQAIENCKKSNNTEWEEIHSQALLDLEKLLPSGSGIDSGTVLNLSETNPDKLVFTFGYHHMSEQGYYTHWTSHKAIVRPSLLVDFDLRITGVSKRDYDLSDYFWETFDYALRQEIEA